MTPLAAEDVRAYLDAGEGGMALSDLRDIAILERAFSRRYDVAALADGLGIHLEPTVGPAA